jgi:hypothetical protein
LVPEPLAAGHAKRQHNCIHAVHGLSDQRRVCGVTCHGLKRVVWYVDLVGAARNTAQAVTPRQGIFDRCTTDAATCSDNAYLHWITSGLSL